MSQAGLGMAVRFEQSLRFFVVGVVGQLMLQDGSQLLQGQRELCDTALALLDQLGHLRSEMHRHNGQAARGREMAVYRQEACLFAFMRMQTSFSF